MTPSKKNNKAIYIQIADDIRYKIKNNLVIEGEKLSSEAELANEYNVSRITSQKALNVLESEGLINRVKGSGSFVAEQSSVANTKNMLDMIAIILPFNSVQGGGMDILSGAETIAGKNGYYVSLHNSQGSLMSERQTIIQLLNDGVKGIIYYPMYTAENFDLLCMLTANKYPIVMIDKDTHDIPIDSVVSDNFDGSYKMTQYLLQNGHKNIAFVSGESIDRLSSIKERFLGYFQAFQDDKIPFNIDNVIYDFSTLANQWNISDIDDIKFHVRLLEYILNERAGVTCIQVVSDFLAIRILKAAQFMGIQIPEQLSVVGFDNIDAATMATPGITTINQDLFQLGAKGAELAIARIKNPNKTIEKIIFPVKLVIRGSVLKRNIKQ